MKDIKFTWGNSHYHLGTFKLKLPCTNSPKEITIDGWVAVDEYGMGGCFLHTQKPHAESREFCDTGEYEIGWYSDGVKYELDSKLFSDLTPESEPKKVRITITPIEE